MTFGTKRYLGVGVETVFGTAVTAQAFIDFTAAELDTPEAPQIVYPGSGGGRMPTVSVAGPYPPSGMVRMGVDPANIGYLLRAFFGGYGVSGSGTYTHTFNATDVETLPSVTARIGRGGVFEHVFAGTNGNRLTLEAEQGGDGIFLMAGADLMSRSDAKAAINSSAKTFPASIYTLHEGVVTIGGGGISTLLESFRVELNNNLDADSGVRFSSRFPVEIPVGAIEVSGSMRLKFGTDAEYERFWGGASGPVAAGNTAVNLQAVFTKGSTTFTIRVPAALWTSVRAPVEGRNRITQTVAFTGYMDGTLGTSLRLILVNPTATYAAA